jgi:hypothetical protein
VVSVALAQKDFSFATKEFRLAARREGRVAKQEEFVEINVGFNQQQRQLIEKIKKEKNMGETDAEVIRAVFVQWLKEEGLI